MVSSDSAEGLVFNAAKMRTVTTFRGHSSLNSEDIIAPEHLAEIRSAPEILPKLLEVFRREAMLSFEQMREAADGSETKNPRELALRAHYLAGAAASLGGQRLADVCRELEAIGRAGTVDGAQMLLSRAATEYELIVKALDEIASPTLV